MLTNLKPEIFLWAIVLDIIVGDPKWLLHPTQMMGSIICFLERILRSKPAVATPKVELATGSVLVIAFLSFVYIIGLSIIWLCSLLPPAGEALLTAWILSTTIAIKSLAQAGLAIYKFLHNNNLKAAQKSVGYIVGRDTERLSMDEVVRATVETLAENTVDGIIAPIFYALLGGIPLALVYKGINTMDSMLGYKNDKYLYFGRVAAKLDDFANYIPARITVLLMVLAGIILKLDWRNGIHHLRIDAKKHLSPNSGFPEALVAGLLGVSLGGVNYYHGIPSYGAILGKPLNNLSPKCILDTIRILLCVSFISVILGFSLLMYIA